MEFGHNILQTCSALHKESNAIRIVLIGVQTKKLRLVKFSATKNSAVVFFELCLRFSASQGVAKVGRWVLSVPRHLYFDSATAAHTDSHCGARKVCSKVALWWTV